MIPRPAPLSRRAAAVWLALAILPTPWAADAPRVLVYQRNGKGFVHDNLRACAEALREIGKENGWAVDVSSDPSLFTPDTLRAYRAVVFANTNNEAFDTPAQREALQGYLRAGGGYVGIHSSTGSERDWPWFREMQGAKFLRHPPYQKFSIRVADAAHPATAHLGATWEWEDEFYLFQDLNPQVHVLLEGDPSAIREAKPGQPAGERLNGNAPLAWTHEFEGGRVFYTALGHKISAYAEPALRRHLQGGIRWAMRLPESPVAEKNP